jgi:chromosome segregation ATPase
MRLSPFARGRVRAVVATLRHLRAENRQLSEQRTDLVAHRRRLLERRRRIDEALRDRRTAIEHPTAAAKMTAEGDEIDQRVAELNGEIAGFDKRLAAAQRVVQQAAGFADRLIAHLDKGESLLREEIGAPPVTGRIRGQVHLGVQR